MSSIDINSGKLVEWIVTRLKMSKDWSDKISVIRQKISTALLDMPESEEIKEIILGTYINYYHCVKILDILKKTESNTRNIFGQYSSKRIKDWQNIIKSYEQGNNYLMDAAQILNQNICFEIPAVKKTIEKNNKTINDSVRKEKDYKASINEATATFKRLCTTYGVDVDPRREGDSDDIRSQLRQSTITLPSKVRYLEEQIETLRKSYELYSSYIQATVEGADVVCPLVAYLLKKGNTTVFEWKHGVSPMLSGKNDILNVTECKEVTDEISWDIGVEEEEEEEDEGFSMVDFGIEVEGEQNGSRENETKSLLEDLETRELLLDDLCEMTEFFLSCVDETKTKAGSLLDSIETAVDGRPCVAMETAQTLLCEVVSFSDLVTEKGLVHLLMVENSSGYLESIVAKMERERSTLLKYHNLESLLKTAVAEAVEDNVKEEEKLLLLRRQCSELKEFIEAKISSVIGGERVVRIVGEVVTI